MPDVREVLNEKEVQLDAIRQEVDALRLVALLLAENTDDIKKPPQSAEQLVRKDGTSDESVKWP